MINPEYLVMLLLSNKPSFRIGNHMETFRYLLCHAHPNSFNVAGFYPSQYVDKTVFKF